MAHKTSTPPADTLTRRERQIMDLVFAKESITAREIWEQMEDPPTYSTVRTLLGVLEKKQQLAHKREGKTFVYYPLQKRQVVAESALRRLVRTFFNGSVEQAVSGLLEMKDTELSKEDVERISQIIENSTAGKNEL
jgi:predicted transcriptional regulator